MHASINSPDAELLLTTQTTDTAATPVQQANSRETVHACTRPYPERCLLQADERQAVVVVGQRRRRGHGHTVKVHSLVAVIPQERVLAHDLGRGCVAVLILALVPLGLRDTMLLLRRVVVRFGRLPLHELAQAPGRDTSEDEVRCMCA